MEIRSIYLKNFLSFKELSHTFVNSPILVKGKNLTEIESKETNGTGKSSIQAGVAYAILASPLRKQTLDRDLIFWGEEEAIVSLTMYCPIRKEELVITRVIKTKGSSTLQLVINGNSVQIATVNDGNKFILNWIGITSEDIRNYYIINKENYRSFIQMSNTDKLALINRFIKADGLDGADAIIKEKVKPLQAKSNEYTTEINRIEGEISVYKQQLVEEQLRNIEWEKESRVKALQEANDNLREGINEAKTKNEENRAEINRRQLLIKENREALENLLKTLRMTEKDYSSGYAELDKERKLVNDERLEVRRERKKHEDFIAERESIIKRLQAALNNEVIVCPACSHKFFLNSDKTVEEVQKEISENNLSIEKENEVFSELDEIENEIIAALAQIDEKYGDLKAKEEEMLKSVHAIKLKISSYKLALAENEENVNILNNRIITGENYIKLNEKQIEQNNVSINEISQMVVESKEEEISGFITLAEKKLEKVKVKLDKNEKEISEIIQWGERFKEFKMFLACGQLRIIQDFTNLSLQRQRSELRVVLDGFKRNAKGVLKSEISMLVINEEGEYKNYWSFSGGERARIEMALIQAFQEMINATNKWGGLHFLMIDEVLEGTDPLGLALLVDSLSENAFPIYIISHVMNIRSGIPTLTVIKEHGISCVEYEE